MRKGKYSDFDVLIVFRCDRRRLLKGEKGWAKKNTRLRTTKIYQKNTHEKSKNDKICMSKLTSRDDKQNIVRRREIENGEASMRILCPVFVFSFLKERRKT